MKNSIHTTMRLRPEAFDILNSFCQKSKASRGMFISDIMFMLKGISKDSEKFKELVGPVLYEKYFK